MSPRLAFLLALPLLAFSAVSAKAAPAAAPTAASTVPFPALPIPRDALAFWSSAKTQLKDGNLTVLDTVGGNHFTAPWITDKPGPGLFFDGTQSAAAKMVDKQAVAPNFCISVDLMPSGGGTEHQTPLYLFNFCELRYRLSRSELSFLVWRKDNAGDIKTSGTVKLPIVPGKWNRVQAVIKGDSASLTVNGVTATMKLENSWDGLSDAKALMMGFGGTDRPYQGAIDNILFTHAP